MVDRRPPVGVPPRSQPRPGGGSQRHLSSSRPGQQPGPRPRPAQGGTTRLRLAEPMQRLHWLRLLLAIAVTLFMGRAVQLQALQASSYAADAAEQMTQTRTLEPQRGTITDRFGTVMAASVPAVTIIADPMSIARNGVSDSRAMSSAEERIAKAAPAAIAAILAKHLGGTPEQYLPALTTTKDKAGKDIRYVVINQQVDASVWNDISKQMRAGGPVAELKKGAPYWFGLSKQDNPRRIYPSGSVAGNLIGTTSRVDDKAGGRRTTGVTGLEQFLDADLTGRAGKETYESSAYGRIPLGNNTLIPAVDGYNYTSTIDATLQQTAESALAKGIVDAAGSTGTAIVMNIKTGEILADASLPGYDPTKISETAAKNDLLNRSAESMYEPGSVEKVLTMAALADKGMVTADTQVVVPPKLASGGGNITDDFPHGTAHLTARGVIANSSNIGTSLLARQMDKATFLAYLRSFGLGERTGIQLPKETKGLLPKEPMQDYSRDQIAFGQGLSVNALQISAAVAGVVNDGVYNPPTLLKSATDSAGKPVALATPTPRRIISKEASAEVRDMMESVIQLKPKVRAIPGYRTIGKSGTAERPDGKGGYSGSTSSFVLAAPAENPQILVYVVIDEPESAEHQGSQIALPVTNEIMKLALPRYGVAPSTTPAPQLPTTYEP